MATFHLLADIGIYDRVSTKKYYWDCSVQKLAALFICLGVMKLSISRYDMVFCCGAMLCIQNHPLQQKSFHENVLLTRKCERAFMSYYAV